MIGDAASAGSYFGGRSLSRDSRLRGRTLRKRRFTVFRVIPKIHTSRLELPLKLAKAVEDSEEDLLGDVLRLRRIVEPLEGKAIYPGEIGLVEEIECLLAAAQDARERVKIPTWPAPIDIAPERLKANSAAMRALPAQLLSVSFRVIGCVQR